MSKLIGSHIIREHPFVRGQTLPDGNIISIVRDHRVIERIRMGPNEVSAIIIRGNGDIENLGVSFNLLTNIGRDWLAGTIGGFIPAGGQNAPATTVTVTAVTGTGTVWTASAFGTPQLGVAGMRVIAPVTGLTTAPVYGNVGGNTTSVLTIDQWWTGTDTTGTTPANTNSFILAPGDMSAARYMALTLDSGAASATDTALPTEIVANGCSRAMATYAHSYGAATFTLAKAYSVTGTETAIHKMGLLTCSTATAAGILVFESVLNQDATVGNLDTLTVTDTITLSG